MMERKGTEVRYNQFKQACPKSFINMLASEIPPWHPGRRKRATMESPRYPYPDKSEAVEEPNIIEDLAVARVLAASGSPACAVIESAVAPHRLYRFPFLVRRF